MTHHYKENLISRKLGYARKTLVRICAMLDHAQITYHLEGGTLLGIVRDGDLLPWDVDLDISIMPDNVQKIKALRWQFLRSGWQLSVRRSSLNKGPIQKGQIGIFKIKPLWAYIIQMINPKHEMVVLDIFVKVKDATHTYWQANGKVMRVENRYYQSFDTVDYRGAKLKVPNFYRDYLSEKYGDWSVPIKEWDCTVHELTVIK